LSSLISRTFVTSFTSEIFPKLWITVLVPLLKDSLKFAHCHFIISSLIPTST
jgi:hypothetical protein